MLMYGVLVILWYTIDRKVQILVMSCLLWQLTFSSPSGSLHSCHPAWVRASICAPSFWLQNYLFVARITLKWPLELKLVCLGSTLCLPRHLITLPWRSIMKRSLLHFAAMSYNEIVTLAIVCIRGAAGFSLVKTLQFHSRLTGWGSMNLAAQFDYFLGRKGAGLATYSGKTLLVSNASSSWGYCPCKPGQQKKPCLQNSNHLCVVILHSSVSIWFNTCFGVTCYVFLFQSLRQEPIAVSSCSVLPPKSPAVAGSCAWSQYRGHSSQSMKYALQLTQHITIWHHCREMPPKHSDAACSTTSSRSAVVWWKRGPKVWTHFWRPRQCQLWA